MSTRQDNDQHKHNDNLMMRYNRRSRSLTNGWPMIVAVKELGSRNMRGQSWDEFFLALAHAVASRASCPRRTVGAVITRDHRILGYGYNGALEGTPDCMEAGCIIEGNHCVRAIHAEHNALKYATQSVEEATLYCTSPPCRQCSDQLVGHKIRRLVCDMEFSDPQIAAQLARRGVVVDVVQPV